MNNFFTINVNGRLLTTERPLVMGILNVTSDSFFEGSRVAVEEIAKRATSMLDAGADIIDIGACSTRPGGEPVTLNEELERVHAILDILDKELPHAVVSVDTFRAQVARESVVNHNVAIINDVSGFEWDSNMLDTVAELNVPYVLTHSMGSAGEQPHYNNFLPEVLEKLAGKLWQLRQRGVCDVMIDPGFGFGKSLRQNYRMMAHLKEFSIFDAPLLVGVSRKSMITKLLSLKPSEALNATTALNTVALMNGADILRVHDVVAATEAVEIYMAVKAEENCANE